MLWDAEGQVCIVLDENRKIYVVKDVRAIPLGDFQQATSATGAVLRNNAAKARRSLLMSPSLEYSGDNARSPDEVGNRVKFAEEFQVKVMSPVPDDEFSTPDRPPSPASMVSVASSVSSELSAAPITKVLATRLSFWSRLSKRNDTKTLDVESPLIAEEEARPLDTLIHEDMAEPKEVLNKIIEAAAPPPASIRQKYTELESKVLRQTLREFSKGEMYFAYDFGMTMHLSQ